jgi:hypothetical protein
MCKSCTHLSLLQALLQLPVMPQPHSSRLLQQHRLVALLADAAVLQASTQASQKLFRR